MASETEYRIPEELRDLPLADPEEADLLWDEYKYRHDLIWRHLIRSTLALVALVTVAYVDEFVNDPWLVGFAFLAALFYWAITFATIDRELQLYDQVKAWHRYRQYHLLCLHDESAGVSPERRAQRRSWGRIYLKEGFPRRVGVYLILLLIAILLVGLYELVA